MNFCSQCGSEELQQEIPAGDNRIRVVCQNCETIHYTNPKVVAGCLPIYDGKILLARRAIEPRRGYWNLPAGYLENGETVMEGAIRETMEETGASIRIVRLHALYNLTHVNQLYLFYLADVLSDEFDGGEESLEVKLFAPEDIPYDEMAFTSSEFAIRRYLAYLGTSYHGVHIGSYDETS